MVRGSMKERMKKTLTYLLLCAFCIAPCMAYSPQDDYIPSAKECKKICQKLEKEGWSVYGSPEKLEVAMTHLYERQKAEKSICFIGSSEAKSINTALRKATNNATIQYASMKGSEVDSHTILELKNSTKSDEIVSSETLSSSSASSVKQNIKALKPIVKLKRQLDNNIIEVRVYCLANPIK